MKEGNNRLTKFREAARHLVQSDVHCTELKIERKMLKEDTEVNKQYEPNRKAAYRKRMAQENESNRKAAYRKRMAQENEGNRKAAYRKRMAQENKSKREK